MKDKLNRRAWRLNECNGRTMENEYQMHSSEQLDKWLYRSSGLGEANDIHLLFLDYVDYKEYFNRRTKPFKKY